jgi:hypothetical protein
VSTGRVVHRSKPSRCTSARGCHGAGGGALGESGSRVESVLVVEAAEDRRRRDPSAFGQAMSVKLQRHRQARRRTGNLRPKAGVGPGLVVVADPAGEHAPEMILREWNEPVQALAAERDDEAFGECVGFRSSDRALKHDQAEPRLPPPGALTAATPWVDRCLDSQKGRLTGRSSGTH